MNVIIGIKLVNMEAALTEAVGTEARTACDFCAKAYGTFSHCVTVPGVLKLVNSLTSLIWKVCSTCWTVSSERGMLCRWNGPSIPVHALRNTSPYPALTGHRRTYSEQRRVQLL